MFSNYLELGFDHISDLDGYDHILFIVVICAIYHWEEWKKILILVTAFTIGHSLTLALAVFDIVSVSRDFIEFLIPVTIMLTALSNIIQGEKTKERSVNWNYLLVLGFGLIHGLGFSNYLKALLGKSGDVFTPLLAFNIGVELGQLVIVAVFFAIAVLILKGTKLPFKRWTDIVSGAAFGIALILVKDSDWLKSWFE